MVMLMIECPKTRKPIRTGTWIDVKSFKTADLRGNSLKCPLCRQLHTWTKNDVLPLE